MNRSSGLVLVLALVASFLLTPSANAWDEQPTNPFPGVGFGEEIPGYTKIAVCTDTPEVPDNCIRRTGQPECPAWSANDITPTLRLDGSWSSVKLWCRASWTAPVSPEQEAAYQQSIRDAMAAAEAESKAWNAANPGRQKCVQWGPLVHPNGVGVASGGVCANPVPAGTAPSGSDSISSSPVTESDLDGSSSSGVTSSFSVALLPLDPIPGDSVYRGSGYPYTQVVDGQVGVTGCPVGFQAANGLIVDVGTKRVYTECWPERAWIAYRLGGEAWDLYKASGGSYDPSVEIDRRNKVLLIRSRAKAIAEAAALLTPGVERCSAWSGFGESGRECAYAFIVPNGQSVSSSATLSSSTSSTISSETSTSNSTSSPSSISVGLASSTIEGSSTNVASWSLLITPDSQEASSISQLATSITNLSTVQRTLVQALPKDKSLNYKVTSLTPKICQASSARVRISKAGVCKVGFAIVDSAGNRYQIVKKLRRSF